MLLCGCDRVYIVWWYVYGTIVALFPRNHSNTRMMAFDKAAVRISVSPISVRCSMLFVLQIMMTHASSHCCIISEYLAFCIYYHHRTQRNATIKKRGVVVADGLRVPRRRRPSLAASSLGGCRWYHTIP